MTNPKPYAGPDPEVIHQLFLCWVDKLVAGKTDFATARLALLDALLAVEYEPLHSDEGTLDDFTTEERLTLVIDTNVSLRQCYRQWTEGQEQAILDTWPAQELYRAFETDESVDWLTLWRSAGGQVIEGRMIARKNTTLWPAISSFGLPYPPFASGSGFDVRDIKRSLAVEAGLLDRRDRIAPQALPPPSKLFLF